jgi:hypothetical protein
MPFYWPRAENILRVCLSIGQILQGNRAVGSAQLTVPAIFHGSTSCGADGIIYEFFTQPVRAVLA